MDFVSLWWEFLPRKFGCFFSDILGGGDCEDFSAINGSENCICRLITYDGKSHHTQICDFDKS